MPVLSDSEANIMEPILQVDVQGVSRSQSSVRQLNLSLQNVLKDIATIDCIISIYRGFFSKHEVENRLIAKMNCP